MDWTQLLASALALVVAFAVRWLFTQIGWVIDDAQFKTLVAAIVVWLLHLFGVGAVKAGVKSASPRLHAALFTPEVK